MKETKQDYLKRTVEHIDIKSFDARPIIKQMSNMAFQARNLARAADLYDRMLADKECGVILCLAGSLISAGLRQTIVDMIQNRMVDAIVSTGANIVDQDFFEALGFRHYIGNPKVDDRKMYDLHIDRIYDTFIDEDELRICDNTIHEICNKLETRPYSSREFIGEMGRYLKEQGKGEGSIVLSAYEENLPIFCPAFSDCSAGFGFIMHQWERKGKCVTLDVARDFLELTKAKLACKDSGLLMIGGGVPKNFAQDVVVAADLLKQDAPMHKFAIQLTVADERDGALSGSTLSEANSWGKVDNSQEQMVFGEATITMPLLVSYAYHQGSWKNRKPKQLTKSC